MSVKPRIKVDIFVFTEKLKKICTYNTCGCCLCAAIWIRLVAFYFYNPLYLNSCSEIVIIINFVRTYKKCRENDN